MSDNRDFDLRNLPGIEEMLASGVPESMDLSAWIEALERERDAYRTGGEKLNARLHVLAEQLHLSKQEIARLGALNGTLRRELEGALLLAKIWRQERDAARAALKQYGRHSSQCYDPCAVVCDCVCGLAAVLEAKEEPGSP